MFQIRVRHVTSVLTCSLAMQGMVTENLRSDFTIAGIQTFYYGNRLLR
jgi:hypothetical protein